MAIFVRSDTLCRIHPEPQSVEKMDYLDHLPDSIVLLVLNKICDVKSLGRCSLLSKRFRSLVPQVENVLVRVDCVISDNVDSSSNKPRSASDHFSAIFRLVLGGIIKPLQALGQLLSTKRSSTSQSGGEIVQTHHSPTEVLKNFQEIRFLRIELPTGELAIEDGIILKWRAEFGSTLQNCLILGASSVIHSATDSVVEDNASIPESFYTDGGGLKLRVVWTISSLIAASARHYLLHPIIGEHKMLDSLVMTDVDGQGTVCMNRDQLDELRVKPLSASSASKRTLVPALNIRLWYAPSLELPDGTVFKGATLVAIRPTESKKEVCDVSWVSSAFDEPTYAIAANMLVKRRTYCLEMNSF